MSGEPLLLFGLVPRTSVTPDTSPPHRRVACEDGLDAIVTEAGTQAETDPEAHALQLAMLQAAVLSAYAMEGDVLPVALGSAFSGHAALAAHLRAQSPLVAAERAAILGAAEYIVAIDKRQMAPPAPANCPGSGYLRQRQSERTARGQLDRDRRAFVSQVVSTLRRAGARLASPRVPSSGSFITVSALLRRSAAGEMAAALDALGSEASRLALSIRMIGPCAPFSFVAQDRPDA